MNLLKAEVVDRFDPVFNQGFIVKLQGQNSNLVKVNFTSPYASRGLAGLVGHVPEIGTTVLVTELDGEYYYIASTFDYTEPSTDGKPVKGFGLGDYLSKNPSEQKVPISSLGLGTPDEIRLQHSLGQGLKIVNRLSPEVQDVRAELYTPLGKRIYATDNPKANSISLDADSLGSKFARVDLTGDDPKNTTMPGHAFRVITSGPQRQISTTGEMELYVQDGTEMNFLNSSTGMNSEGIDGPYWGNVNLQSKNRDVNVFTKAEDGRIFIECLNDSGSQQIVIETNSSDGTITIRSQGKLNLIGEDINIEAKNNLKMISGTSTKIGGTLVDIFSAGPLNADGTAINLNSGLSQVDLSPTEEPPQSHYGNDGIFTP